MAIKSPRLPHTRSYSRYAADRAMILAEYATKMSAARTTARPDELVGQIAALHAEEQAKLRALREQTAASSLAARGGRTKPAVKKVRRVRRRKRLRVRAFKPR
jgi:hypothetical protein